MRFFVLFENSQTPQCSSFVCNWKILFVSGRRNDWLYCHRHKQTVSSTIHSKPFKTLSFYCTVVTYRPHLLKIHVYKENSTNYSYLLFRDKLLLSLCKWVIINCILYHYKNTLLIRKTETYSNVSRYCIIVYYYCFCLFVLLV